MVTFLDKLGLSQAVFIGHDWGGMLVWYMALFHPERVRAVASLNTPFIPANPNVHPMESIKANPVFDYQLYFQEPLLCPADPSQAVAHFPVCLGGEGLGDVARWGDGFFGVSAVAEFGGLVLR
ncbi:Bifunctional epoxide hydrolase 2 [Saguinus oedipus]|uniref:Bifunctional epoxide hydrolase 2 n=1 Tax=Saguinus oedipus TaxID=9490 RepID=A0ABQ9UA14_SAGOE|nr:Bifunctional epoxide hydrolase 2 [Saguinus oedipus]